MSEDIDSYEVSNVDAMLDIKQENNVNLQERVTMFSNLVSNIKQDNRLSSGNSEIIKNIKQSLIKNNYHDYDRCHSKTHVDSWGGGFTRSYEKTC